MVPSTNTISSFPRFFIEVFSLKGCINNLGGLYSVFISLAAKTRLMLTYRKIHLLSYNCRETEQNGDLWNRQTFFFFFFDYSCFPPQREKALCCVLAGRGWQLPSFKVGKTARAQFTLLSRVFEKSACDISGKSSPGLNPVFTIQDDLFTVQWFNAATVWNTCKRPLEQQGWNRGELKQSNLYAPMVSSRNIN